MSKDYKYTAKGLRRCFCTWLDSRRVSVPLVIRAPRENAGGDTVVRDVECFDSHGEPIYTYVYSESDMPTLVQFLIDAGISDAEFEAYKKDARMAGVCRNILREFENIYQKRSLSGGRAQDMLKQLLQDCRDGLPDDVGGDATLTMDERLALIKDAYEAMAEDGAVDNE